MGQMAKEQGLKFLAKAKYFSLLCSKQPCSWAYPAYPMRIKGSSPAGKAVGHEADHSPPSSLLGA
jgi:hypothetical protein